MQAGKEAFINPFFSAGEKIEDGPFCSGGNTFVEEDYLNYEGSDDILYDFGPSGGGDVQPLEIEEDVEILETSTSIEQVVEVATTTTTVLQGNNRKILFRICYQHSH